MSYPFILLLSFLGSLGLAFILPHELRMFAWVPMSIPLIMLFMPKKKIYARILGMPSVAEDFTRGWLITGFTGSGKTMALTYLLFQIFKHVPNFGAVFLDQKGIFWEIIARMAKYFGREEDLVLVRTKPSNASLSWQPTHTINILGDTSISASSYAAFLSDTYSSLNPKGEGGSSAFFKSKGQEMMTLGIEALRLINKPVTISSLERFLCDELTQDMQLRQLLKLTSENQAALKTYQDILSLQKLPSETLGGTIGYVGNILKPFTEETIASIFCADKPTFSVSEIDQGKLVCISIPQSLTAQRIFINTLLKLFFYFHAQCRFDKSAEERESHNQIFLCADEGQEIITSAYSAFADHRQAAILREAKATIIMATQGYSSIYAALPKEHANVLISSLANQLIFQASSEENAQIAEGFLGSRRKKEFSYSFSGGKRTKSFKWETVPYIHFFKFRKFPKFYCVAKLANGRWRQGYLPPITPEGKTPKWLWGQNPLLAFRGLFIK